MQAPSSTSSMLQKVAIPMQNQEDPASACLLNKNQNTPQPQDLHSWMGRKFNSICFLYHIEFLRQEVSRAIISKDSLVCSK